MKSKIDPRHNSSLFLICTLAQHYANHCMKDWAKKDKIKGSDYMEFSAFLINHLHHLNSGSYIIQNISGKFWDDALFFPIEYEICEIITPRANTINEIKKKIEPVLETPLFNPNTDSNDYRVAVDGDVSPRFRHLTPAQQNELYGFSTPSRNFTVRELEGYPPEENTGGPLTEENLVDSNPGPRYWADWVTQTSSITGPITINNTSTTTARFSNDIRLEQAPPPPQTEFICWLQINKTKGIDTKYLYYPSLLDQDKKEIYRLDPYISHRMFNNDEIEDKLHPKRKIKIVKRG